MAQGAALPDSVQLKHVCGLLRLMARHSARVALVLLIGGRVLDGGKDEGRGLSGSDWYMCLFWQGVHKPLIFNFSTTEAHEP